MALTLPLSVARDAFIADEIDVEEFEAALAGVEIEITPALQLRAYTHVQQQVRFCATPLQPLRTARFIGQ